MTPAEQEMLITACLPLPDRALFSASLWSQRLPRHHMADACEGKNFTCFHEHSHCRLAARFDEECRRIGCLFC